MNHSTSLLLFVSVLAVIPSRATMQHEPHEPVVKGYVMNSVAEVPISNAVLTLQADGQPVSFSAASAKDGSFEFRAVPNGDYRLAVRADGFVPLRFGATNKDVRGEVLRVRSDRSISELKVLLSPFGKIVGRVLDDEEGKPAAGCEVVVLKSIYLRGRRTFVRFRDAGTNDLGEYRAVDLPPGQYYVAAHSQLGAKDKGYAPVYYPGVNEIQAALPIEVHAGREVPVDFRVTLTKTYHVRGKVTAEVGRRVSILLDPSDSPVLGLERKAAHTRPVGEFNIGGVLPGRYTIALHDTDTGEKLADGLPIEVREDVNDIRILEAGQLDLTGMVEIAETNPVGREPKPPLDGLRIMLENADGAPQRPALVNVKSDGSLAARVSKLAYHVRFHGLPNGYYPTLMTLGNERLSSCRMDLQPLGARAVFRVRLGPAGASIVGNVEDGDGKPAANAVVVLVPEPAQRDLDYLYHEVVSDGKGSFVIEGVAPGNYKVFAWSDIPTDAYRSAEFVKRYEAYGVSVDVSNAQRLRRDVRLASEP